MRVTVAHGRSQLPFSASDIAVSSGGTTTVARTLYFAIQGETKAGLNLLSSIVGPVAISPGQKVVITLNESARTSGEWWESYVISASTSNDPQTFVQLAKINAYTVGGALISLPSTLSLDRDSSFLLSEIANVNANLPNDPLHGMLRGVASLAAVYEYDLYGMDDPDGMNVLSSLSGVGRWYKQGGSFSTYISSTEGVGGCALDISNVDVKPDRYTANGGNGKALRLWMINNTTQPESRGRRLGLVVKLNDETKTDFFNGLLWLAFRGYVNVATGVTRTQNADTSPFPLVDQNVLFQSRKSNLVLPDDLLPQEAYAFDIYPNFTVSDLKNSGINGAILKVFPFFYQESGEYSEAGALIGDAIYSAGDRRYVLPSVGLSAKVLSGSGIIDSFSFPDVKEVTLTGLSANTANQIITIDGNGTVGLGVLPILGNEAIRAIVSTLDGVGFPSDWSAPVYVPLGDAIEVTLNYPILNTGVCQIRADYPDQKIAGHVKAYFNPTSVVLYLQRLSDGQIKKFPAVAVVSAPTQEITLPNWSVGTVIDSLPLPVNQDFGLFAPGISSATVIVAGTDYAASQYAVAFAFEYKNTITSVSHDEARGCVLTQLSPITQSLARMQFWGEAVVDIAALRSVPLSEIASGQQRSVMIPRDVFRYDPVSIAVDDSEIFIKPSAVAPSSPGRWIAVRSPRPSAIVLKAGAPLPQVDSNEVILYASTTLQYRTQNSNTFSLAMLEANQSFTAAQISQVKEILSSSAVITIDASYSNRFRLVLLHSTVLNVVNFVAGSAFEVEIVQGGSGNFELAFSSVFSWSGLAPLLSKTAGLADILWCVSYDGVKLRSGLTKGYS